MKCEPEEIVNLPDIKPKDLKMVLGPRNIQAYKNLGLEKSSTDGYFILILGYAESPIQDFESYL